MPLGRLMRHEQLFRSETSRSPKLPPFRFNSNLLQSDTPESPRSMKPDGVRLRADLAHRSAHRRDFEQNRTRVGRCNRSQKGRRRAGRCKAGSAPLTSSAASLDVGATGYPSWGEMLPFVRARAALSALVQIPPPRLKITTARCIDLRRAVSRLVRASYANHEAQLSQFKRAKLFRVRRGAIARTYCRIGSYGVQIQSPLSEFGSLVRVLIGELSGRLCEPNPWSHVLAEGFLFWCRRIACWP